MGKYEKPRDGQKLDFVEQFAFEKNDYSAHTADLYEIMDIKILIMDVIML